ncbi:hypothetical protein DERP_010442 [Dermatophagoides pteronyssinus]|uniref:Uncharacterized protein n=1 Tax=Dermatophagoides pteronyssinus TaxID=6956 RepID=A0ABQ8J502_DERPT|nr:hypothetical protein DERP_010442 [Dermatophagoides pteronyssinus]
MVFDPLGLHYNHSVPSFISHLQAMISNIHLIQCSVKLPIIQYNLNEFQNEWNKFALYFIALLLFRTTLTINPATK